MSYILEITDNMQMVHHSKIYSRIQSSGPCISGMRALLCRHSEFHTTAMFVILILGNNRVQAEVALVAYQ
jgi:hypothetical protein